MKQFIDLVVCGPDMSGTSTQIEDIIGFFQSIPKKVRDMRGTEFDALFHADQFEQYNKDIISLKNFLNYSNTDYRTKKLLAYQFVNLLSGLDSKQDLKVASMVKNDITTYIDPNKADVWIFEEPTKRGAGQVNRVIEQNRSAFSSDIDHISAAYTHQVYRIDEFLRFRQVLRELGKIIIRSRSEESACYQVYDDKNLLNGIKLDTYLELPGHKIAFTHPPTHLFIVCGPENWTEKEYLKLKEERSGDRIADDYELNAAYQVLVNNRYATDWLEKLYEKGYALYGGKVPIIKRFNIYDSKEEIRNQMNQVLLKMVS